MAKSKQDREIQEYRNLMTPPEHFEDGFNWKTVVGAFFLGFIMMPGILYITLVTGLGGSMSSAARWMTIILFAEVGRRSLQDLKQQEIYTLFFMAGLMMTAPNQAQGLLWNQFFVRSEYAQAMGIAQEVPSWWAPSAQQIAENGRTFFVKPWIIPILFTSFALVISRLDHYGLGYILYRLTSDVEQLPFPMAPVNASGITALANTHDPAQSWRWRCFSIGGVIGMVFGVFYIGIPAVTGALLAKPLQLIPIPWVDLTPAVSKFIPAFPFNLQFDLGLVFVGMVIPFWAVIGGAVGVVLTMIMCPMLHHMGILSHWTEQMSVVDTLYINKVDFFLSFEVGLTVAVALVSLGTIGPTLYRALFARAKDTGTGITFGQQLKQGWDKLVTKNVQRGDFSIYLALLIYICTSAAWIGLSTYLIEGFPWHFFVLYAAVYTPLISYATAKLEGMCGQALTIPLIREATYILSGYQGVKIWFAPAPRFNYGVHTVEFRVLELTGTKIKSQVKTLLIGIPMIVISMVVFSQLLWFIADVPSDAYPFVQKMWDLRVKNMCLTFSSTMEGGSLFMEAWNFMYFFIGLALGTVSFVFLSLLGLPTLLVFGVVRGFGQGTPAGITLELVGALVGRFYFRRKFGDMWMKYTPVLLAGFSCGMGLVGMVAIAFTILTKMMEPLIF